MRPNPRTTRSQTQRPAGIALIIAVVTLAVLSSLLAGLSLRVSMAKRRQAYIVEYQRARYALDSALKYALATVPRQRFELSERQYLPDFSDLFVMNQQQYEAFVLAWAETADDEQIEQVLKPEALGSQTAQLSSAEMLSQLSSIFGLGADDANVPGTLPAGRSQTQSPAYAPDADDGDDYFLDPDDIEVPGPYGPPWPHVIEPIELTIGTARVVVTIEDENAKMPLAWTITNQQAVNKEAEVVLSMFGDWMGMSPEEVELLKIQLEQIHEHKAFQLNPSAILLPRQQQRRQTAAERAAQRAEDRRAGRLTTSRTAIRRRQAQQETASPTHRPAVAHAADFAKLFHSSLLDRDLLARPVDHTAMQNVSPLKYLSLWGSQRVNINTAPRHVLEAALAFGGGDPVDLAERIIRHRQHTPFQSIDDLKQAFYSDRMEIERAGDYLTTRSNLFLIRVVAQSGNARASAAAAVIKEGTDVEKLVVLYDR